MAFSREEESRSFCGRGRFTVESASQRRARAPLLVVQVLVGHALSNDLKVLMLSHPRAMIRDTATFRPLMRYRNGKFKPKKLRDLAKEHLGLAIQVVATAGDRCRRPQGSAAAAPPRPL